MRHQKGSICLRSGSFYCRAYVNGKQKNFFLARKDERHHSATCKAVKVLRDEAMLKVNALADQSSTMKASDFWTGTYLPHIEAELRESSVYSYKQIWDQHMKAHLEEFSLSEYKTHHGSVFLTKLAKKYSRSTLSHIRSLASAIFSHALNLGLIESNPWHEVKVLGKVKAAKPTQHYTLEEAENIITALVDHMDCQLAVALGFFMGLRPCETFAVKWEDLDSDWLHVRRDVVRGIVGATKTPDSEASLPLIEPVKTMLKLWKQRSGDPKEGWLLPNMDGKPQDPGNMVSRIIIPHVEGRGRCSLCKVEPPKKEGLKWKGFYSGRRGCGTVLTELTGNLLAAQGMLRHKTMTTTAAFYKKETPQATMVGMKMLEAASKKD